jgi:hypothetical protein
MKFYPRIYADERRSEQKPNSVLTNAFVKSVTYCGSAASRAVRLCLTVSDPKMIGGCASGKAQPHL